MESRLHSSYIPLRVAFTVDIGNMQHIGYLVEPRFTLAHRRTSATGLTHKATMGLKFATRDYHAYYYDVAPEFATPVRSEYESDAGFGGSFINYRISYKTSDFIYWAFIRYQSLRGAEFESSTTICPIFPIFLMDFVVANSEIFPLQQSSISALCRHR